MISWGGSSISGAMTCTADRSVIFVWWGQGVLLVMWSCYLLRRGGQIHSSADNTPLDFLRKEQKGISGRLVLGCEVISKGVDY